MTILNERGQAIRSVDEAIAERGEPLYDGKAGPVKKSGDPQEPLPKMAGNTGLLDQLEALCNLLREEATDGDVAMIAVVCSSSAFAYDLRALAVPGTTKQMIARMLLQAGDKLFQASMSEVQRPAFSSKP